jgi:hypothetical protein
MKSIASRHKDVSDAYTRRLIIDYRLYIGIWHRRKPPNIYLNNTAGDAIWCERIIYAKGY